MFLKLVIGTNYGKHGFELKYNVYKDYAMHWKLNTKPLV